MSSFLELLMFEIRGFFLILYARHTGTVHQNISKFTYSILKHEELFYKQKSLKILFRTMISQKNIRSTKEIFLYKKYFDKTRMLPSWNSIVYHSYLDLNIQKISTIICIRGIRTLDFSRKTTNVVLSGLQIVNVIK